jgi:tetratricopeptide (TPR) repeat protein
MQHCVLEAGDWLYVPEGWYHATLALEDSVSIAAQLGGVGDQQPATSVQRMWSELWLLSADGKVEAAISKADQIIAADPDNREVIYQVSSQATAAYVTVCSDRLLVIYQRALLLSRVPGRRSDAISGFKSAIQANPRQAEPYNNFGGLTMASWQETGEMKGVKAVKKALMKAIQLNPTNGAFFRVLFGSNLDSCLVESGAQETHGKISRSCTKRRGR